MAQHFGCQEVWRSAYLLLLRRVIVDGQPKIGEFCHSSFEQDIAEFDVAMDNAMTMKISKGIDNLVDDFDRGILGNSFHRRQLEQVGQSSIWAVLEHQTNLLGVGPVREELDNVSMITARLDCHFRVNLFLLLRFLNPLARHHFNCRPT